MKSTMFAASAAVMASSALGNQFVMYTPGGDDTAVERIDPIVNWGNHSAHVHQLFGASGLEPEMTHETLLKSSCTNLGSADGRQNLADMSVYWHPAMYMEAKDGSGYVRVPVKSHKLYYRDVGFAGDKLNSPFEFPSGYRALAGNPTNRAPTTDGVVEWHCYTNSGDIIGKNGKFPEGITDCEAFPGLNAHIHYPHCWNGEDFDPEHSDAHYAYPEGDPQSGACPSSHPIRIPHIFSENEYDLHSVVDQVKPGTFVLSNGDATGCGYHADFFNGWESGALPELFTTCPQGQWGNHDIGTCPSFKAGPATTECHQKKTFHEEVDAPGENLPGCNPIISTNPAPKFQIAAIGECTSSCPKAGTAHAADAPSYGSAIKDTINSHVEDAKSKIGSYLQKPTTTLATSAKPVGTAADVAWVTEVVTVTALPTPGSYKRHAHMDHHRNHARSL